MGENGVVEVGVSLARWRLSLKRHVGVSRAAHFRGGRPAGRLYDVYLCVLNALVVYSRLFV